MFLVEIGHVADVAFQPEAGLEGFWKDTVWFMGDHLLLREEDFIAVGTVIVGYRSVTVVEL